MSRPGSRVGDSFIPAEYSDAWVEAMRTEFDGLVANLCGSD